MEFADSLPDICGTDKSIIRVVFWTVPNYITFGHVLEPFVPTSHVRLDVRLDLRLRSLRRRRAEIEKPQKKKS